VPRVSGDWVVWQENYDIKAKNIKTGAFKNVTNDGATTMDGLPVVSGDYVVWQSYNGTDWDLVAKNLATNASSFVFAGGTASQASPSINGKRVAFTDDSNGHLNIRVKTIGSSAVTKITNNGVAQWSPTLGDHLLAWLVNNSDGRSMIREINDGPSDPTYSVGSMRVSGDRILFDRPTATDYDVSLWDARIAKTSGIFSIVGLAATTENDTVGSFSGNELTYMSDNAMYWGKLAVPSISLASVPSRIARGGHIHLAGSISDQGHRIGGASLGIEKLASGRWTRVKTITANSSGAFSYQTPRIYSKTQYRVVYDGRLILFGAGALDHLSTVSGAKTAWPR
jgi:hypothetical protein